MSKPNLQHYIPKTYLRQFQIDSVHNKSFVYCIDFTNKYKRQVQRLGINDKVFKLRKYYNDHNLEDPYSLERIFAEEIEPKYPSIIHEIGKEEAISASVREDLILWMFVSKMRNPALRQNAGRVMERIIYFTNQYKKIYPTPDQQEVINEYVRKSAKEIQLRTFLESEKLKKIYELHFETLASKHWKILKSTEIFPFWTNDNPGFSPNLHPKFSAHTPFHNIMELNSQSVIYYVLSPKYCLEIRPFLEETSMDICGLNMEIKFEDAALEYIEIINQGVFHTRHKLMISNFKTYLNKCIKRKKKDF